MKTKNIPTATYYLQIKRLFANNQTVDKNKMRMLPDKKINRVSIFLAMNARAVVTQNDTRGLCTFWDHKTHIRLFYILKGTVSQDFRHFFA